MNESFRSLRWDWVAFGWFLAAALTSLILLAMTALGLVLWEDSPTDALWMSIALLVSFFVIGLFVGTRVVAAPVLHAVAMALFSVVAWIGVNLFLGAPAGETTWRSLEAATLIALLITQIAAAAVGTRIGVRWMRSPPGVSR